MSRLNNTRNSFNNRRRDYKFEKNTNSKLEFSLQTANFEKEFPVLSNSNVKETSNIDYIGAVLVQNASPKSTGEEVAPGWVRLQVENGNTTWKFGTSKESEYNDDYLFALETDSAINTIIWNWNNYENKYNNLHGENAYEELYYTNKYIDELDLDSDEDV